MRMALALEARKHLASIYYVAEALQALSPPATHAGVFIMFPSGGVGGGGVHRCRLRVPNPLRPKR